VALADCKACPRIERQTRPGVSVARVERDGLTELYVTAAPTSPDAHPAEQASETYGAIAEVLSQADGYVVQERTFGSLDARQAILGERERLLAPAFGRSGWPLNFIEGAPCGSPGLAGVHVHAIVGAAPEPLMSGGQVLGTAFARDGATHVYLTGIERPDLTGPGDAAESMFEHALDALERLDLSFRDVVRTWIYLYDILDWYGEFNEVRRRLYAQWGIGEGGPARHPASTGIEGRPGRNGLCAMDLYAIGGDRRGVLVEQMHNPAQNEAYSYGSAFSRGMAVRFGALETAYVSGTASIDEKGRTVHVGDVAAQTKCTLDKVEALLSTRGMTLEDTVTATLFVKRPDDAQLVRRIVAERSPRLSQGILVRADVCRPDLLFETEVTTARVVCDA